MPVKKGLASIRESLEKTYGDRVVAREQMKPIEAVSTGSLTLDYALRCGGWPIGRIVEIVGIEGVGKTTLVIRSLAEQQRKFPDRAVGYIDMEQTFQADWAEANGLDLSDDRFLLIRPDDSEHVSDMLRKMARTGEFSMVAVDSIGGMESRKAMEKDAEEATVGKNAQIITRMVKECAVLCRAHAMTVVLVNQYRANIGAYNGNDVPAGPKALKYATSVQVTMHRGGTAPLKIRMNGAEEQVGIQVRAKVARSKVAASGRTAEFWLLNQPTDQYGPIGIDIADEAMALGKLAQVIEQKGAWYTLPNGERFQGSDPMLGYLREHHDVAREIRDAAVGTVAHEVEPEKELVFDSTATEENA